MIWPGMGDPAKRKKTIRFLLITAAIGAIVFLGAQSVMSQLSKNDPLKNCIDERDTPFRISATLELIVDGLKADIPANIGFEEGCQRALYTLANDGTIYAEWEEKYPFEIGHFLWIWDFPLRDMDQSKSKIFVNDAESKDFINTPLIQGYHYRAEFTSKAFDSSKDTDFLPPDL
jgi:hypothetical protein